MAIAKRVPNNTIQQIPPQKPALKCRGHGASSALIKTQELPQGPSRQSKDGGRHTVTGRSSLRKGMPGKPAEAPESALPVAGPCLRAWLPCCVRGQGTVSPTRVPDPPPSLRCHMPRQPCARAHHPPPLCKRHTKVPKFDGNHTSRCSDMGGGGIYAGQRRTRFQKLPKQHVLLLRQGRYSCKAACRSTRRSTHARPGMPMQQCSAVQLRIRIMSNARVCTHRLSCLPIYLDGAVFCRPRPLARRGLIMGSNAQHPCQTCSTHDFKDESPHAPLASGVEPRTR